ncbi:hypothetical protein, secreted [gut metagenome]|uniref:Lipoprotein n=1 Tax=gut metagenome TaxID=749906 RepID=J9D6I4_9ZZZZ
MKYNTILGLLLLGLLSSSCGDKKSAYDKEREAAETNGKACLTTARAALAENDFQTAREAVEKMRKEYRLAINARAEGILLMDSINLLEAEHELKIVDKALRDENAKDKDSLQIAFDDLFQKSKFYKRKLEHDKKNSDQ